MRIVLDTNVFVSAVFFSGVPGRILELLRLVTVEAEIIEAPGLPAPVSADPDDDKFFACAKAAGVAASSLVTMTFSITTAGKASPYCAPVSSRASFSPRSRASARVRVAWRSAVDDRHVPLVVAFAGSRG